jgi:formylglycine-generating enzyme required for sulfatase activity
MSAIHDPHDGQRGAACPACGEPLKSTWKVCPVCEAPVGRQACPVCAKPVQENWKLCPECSARLICAACGRRIPPGHPRCPACVPETSTVTDDPAGFIESATGMEFVFVPGASFQMGDLFGDGWANELPVHEVRVDAFFIAKFPVTQGQWAKVMPENPSHFKRGDLHPVEQVTWGDVAEFIRRLNALTVGSHRFRLPSEAEWEYAARSGGKKELYSGGDNVEAVAWYLENSGRSTQPVGRKAPNGLGLCDMSGNVWEWCRDLYDAGAFNRPVRDNPVAAGGGGEHVIRGGSWNLDAWSVRCSRRLGFAEDFFGAGLGFRLVGFGA